MIHKGDSLPGSTGSRSCNRFSRTPLSEAVAKHIDLSATRRETLSWLALLIMQHGTICLWRLAAFVASAAQTSRFSVGSTQVLQAFPESSRRYRESPGAVGHQVPPLGDRPAHARRIVAPSGDVDQVPAPPRRTTVSDGRRAAFAPASLGSSPRFGSAQSPSTLQSPHRSSPIRPPAAILP